MARNMLNGKDFFKKKYLRLSQYPQPSYDARWDAVLFARKAQISRKTDLREIAGVVKASDCGDYDVELRGTGTSPLDLFKRKAAPSS